MADQTVHQDPPNPHYGTEFSTYSLGTEEELTDGPGVIIDTWVAGVDPKVFAIVRDTEDGKNHSDRDHR